VAHTRRRQLWGSPFANVRWGWCWGWGGGQKPETKLSWLNFGSAVSNSKSGRWWEVVVWLIQGNGGCGAVHLDQMTPSVMVI
jgi:hypothetical protein